MDAKKFISIKEAYASIYEQKGKEEDKKEKDCVDKSEKGAHNCAKKVCHEEFGEGNCVFGEHAEPDRYGFVSHYDVLFEHGVEKGVPVDEMRVLTMEAHPGHKTMYAHTEVEGEDLTEEMIVEEMGSHVYDLLEVYLMSEGATEEEVAYIVENDMEELIDEGILGAALKIGSKLLKGGKLLKGAGAAIKSAKVAFKGSKGAGSAVKQLGKLGSGNVTTAGAKMAPKAGSRAAQLQTKYGIGAERSMTSAKRKIINRARSQVSSAERQQKMGNASQSYVDKAKSALDKYLKAGYSKYGADLPMAGKGSKAARRAAELKNK
tara:strand:+ start:5189 stop:6145 length:957 start_codon:yes stop_codon:yes gene_type:complete